MAQLMTHIIRVDVPDLARRALLIQHLRFWNKYPWGRRAHGKSMALRSFGLKHKDKLILGGHLLTNIRIWNV